MARFERRFAPRLEELGPARQALQAWLDESGVPPPASWDVLVVASELSTNGIIHDGGAPIVLRAVRDPVRVHLEVQTTDLPAGASPRARIKRDADEMGRGLQIVDALADRVSTRKEGLRRTVTCELALDGDPRQP